MKINHACGCDSYRTQVFFYCSDDFKLINLNVTKHFKVVCYFFPPHARNYARTMTIPASGKLIIGIENTLVSYSFGSPIILKATIGSNNIVLT